MLKPLNNMWRIVSICSLAVIGFVSLAPITHAQAPTEDVVIAAFESKIEVMPDRSAHVVETIHTVFNTPRHGIFRDIPVFYTDLSGNRFDLQLDVQSVLLNNNPVPFERSWKGRNMSLKIGDPEVFVEGLQTYAIEYTVQNVVTFYEGYDEFYWNVTGTDWELPLNNPSVEIRFPAGTVVKQQACYTGEYGSQEQNCTVQVEGNVVRAKGDHYLTIAAGVEKGVIHEPTRVERLWMIVRDNWWGLIPLLLLGWTYSRWHKFGRDVRKETVIPQYDAPEGMNAAAAAVLHGSYKMKFVLTAMIVEMAMGGYLEMNVTEKKNGKVKDIVLKKLKDSDGLDERYADLFNNVLFRGDRSEVSLKQIGKDRSGSKVMSIVQKLVTVFRRNVLFDPVSLRRQILFVLLGAAMIIGSFFALAFGLFVATCTFVSGIGVFILGFLMRRRTEEGSELLRHVEGLHLFIKTAEVHRSEFQQREGMFEKVLPFAIAFGLAKHWARAFPDLQYQPNWYHGTQPFTVSGFTHSFNSLSNQMYHNLAKTPASSSSGFSSGSSGGGFSGGGFGGGGGGSW